MFGVVSRDDPLIDMGLQMMLQHHTELIDRHNVLLLVIRPQNLAQHPGSVGVVKPHIH